MTRKLDPEIAAHLTWLGFVQPTGLVVSPHALVRAGVVLTQRDAVGHDQLRALVKLSDFENKKIERLAEPSFRTFATQVLDWSFAAPDYAGTPEQPIPPELEVPLTDYGETLRPSYAVREPNPKEGAPRWQLLVCELPAGAALDGEVSGEARLDAHARLDRLLRATGVSAGILFNGRTLRLVSAPYGETSGWLDFQVAQMVLTAGRPICTALRELLCEERLLLLDPAKRFAALLLDSRKFQNEVSEQLAQQVLHALYELLRGFQSADDASRGALLGEHVRGGDPNEVYRALLTVILRLVFLLYTEERDLLPKDATFLRHYSLAGLFERLRADAALYPDTMDQRYGAWAQLLALFRLIHDGPHKGGLAMPRRRGALFDPDRFKFLEGRSGAGVRQLGERIEAPLVPDGHIFRALEKLLVLDGERISYRALDVEQIGSVYETMMGFLLNTAQGVSIAIKAQKKSGAPTTIDLEALLAENPEKRAARVADETGRKLGEGVKRTVSAARSLEDLHAALRTVVDDAATPDRVPRGALVLQPSEERRRSGSHYTPRTLTQPIVRTTLAPILERLRSEAGGPPRPEQILELKVCDPAMGSGAFLVEACRQLGEALVDAWRTHGGRPALPPDETELVFAYRLVAQRCLYGVDRNPVAVDLAKVSLWLITLAKDHPLTFLDHALRHGDSLVGLTRRQIEGFHWEGAAPRFQLGSESMRVSEHMARVAALRRQIREARDDGDDLALRGLWDDATRELDQVRLFGDLVVAAYFSGEKPREREAKRAAYASDVLSGRAELHRERLAQWREEEKPLAPFHWEIEFPEVFERENPGFDAFVGNPPFMAGTKISRALSPNFMSYLGDAFEQSRGKSDLVAYFFRRAFELLRGNGAFGLVTTKTIREGATRFSGLRWIRTNGGQIFSATRRLAWQGTADVVVSVVHVLKGRSEGALIDGRQVPKVTAYLFPFGPDEDPARLVVNDGAALSGVNPNGRGFVLSAEERAQFLAADPRCAERISPYLGSVEMNESPDAKASRYIIAFPDETEEGVRAYPILHSHLHETVRLQRQASAEKRLRDRWWAFSRPANELTAALERLPRVLVSGRHATYHTVAFQPVDVVFSDAVTVFLFADTGCFAVLQSRTHEGWAEFQGSTLKDDPRYIPEDCFETFPFPENWQTHPALEAAGQAYYEFRAALMVRNNEGLTKAYNRFHDPDEPSPDIQKLRDLHAAMDRAVLDAYGWRDIPIECKFQLDYEIDEEEHGDKKKPYRLRWPDEVRDEVLARLLDLNARRAAEEQRSGAAAEAKQKKTAKRAKKKRSEPENGELF